MFVGTPLYQSPEMLMHSISSPAMDLWALGVIIYEMLIGQTPFHSNSEIEVYRKIEIREMNIPPNIKNSHRDAAEIIDCLLQIDPRTRLGAG